MGAGFFNFYRRHFRHVRLSLSVIYYFFRDWQTETSSPCTLLGFDVWWPRAASTRLPTDLSWLPIFLSGPWSIGDWGSSIDLDERALSSIGMRSIFFINKTLFIFIIHIDLWIFRADCWSDQCSDQWSHSSEPVLARTSPFVPGPGPISNRPEPRWPGRGSRGKISPERGPSFCKDVKNQPPLYVQI